MPTIQFITAKQVVRFGDLASIPLRDAIAEAAKNLGITTEEAQTCLTNKGDEFQARLKQPLEILLKNLLSEMIGRRHSAATDLEQYFKEVFGVVIDLTRARFPEKEGFPVYMVVPKSLQKNEHLVLVLLGRYFCCKITSWENSFTEIDRKTKQRRPKYTYVFAHRGGDEPDVEHLGKSYNDVASAKIVFANPLEYLLMTGFHMWKHKKWMDQKGRTCASSLWTDFCSVCCFFRHEEKMLYLSFGERDDRHPDNGPRELFLG